MAMVMTRSAIISSMMVKPASGRGSPNRVASRPRAALMPAYRMATLGVEATTAGPQTRVTSPMSAFCPSDLGGRASPGPLREGELARGNLGPVGSGPTPGRPDLGEAGGLPGAAGGGPRAGGGGRLRETPPAPPPDAGRSGGVVEGRERH